MLKFNSLFIILPIVATISVILGQVNSIQSNINKPSLILFNRLEDGIFTLDIHMDEEKRITSEKLLSAKSWSPDGNRILALQGNENPFRSRILVVMDADGQNRQQLTDPDKLDPSFSGIWSPDSSRVFFWAQNVDGETGQPKWSIYSALANDGSIQQLIEPTLSRGGIALSPDGTKIIYTQEFKLYALTPDGENLTVSDIPLRRSPIIAWSPDGSLIATTTSNQDKEFGIYIFEPDGSNVRLLVSDDIHTISWSPDSSELLYREYVRGGWDLVIGIVNIETGKIERYQVGHGVLESLKAITGAIWSPDGLQIVLSGVL